MHTKVLESAAIRFNSSIYTVSEDDSFINLTIVKNISDAESTTDNITVHFITSDQTAKGTCMYARLARKWLYVTLMINFDKIMMINNFLHAHKMVGTLISLCPSIMNGLGGVPFMMHAHQSCAGDENCNAY